MSKMHGSWDITLDTPFGEKELTMMLSNVNGVEVGVFEGEEQQVNLEGLIILDNRISFSADLPTPMGVMTIPFAAEIENDSLKGEFKTVMGSREFNGNKVS